MIDKDCKHKFEISSIDKNGIFGLKKVAYTYCIKCGKIGMEENTQSPQKYAPESDAMRESKCSRSETPVIGKTVNDSENQTEDTHSTKQKIIEMEKRADNLVESFGIKEELNKEISKDYG